MNDQQYNKNIVQLFIFVDILNNVPFHENSMMRTSLCYITLSAPAKIHLLMPKGKASIILNNRA